MGGLAFASGSAALFTPRMSPAVYRAVRERCVKSMQSIFVCVATPIQGPGKKDYGDIDLFAVWRREEVFPTASVKKLTATLPREPLPAAAQLLGAVHTQQQTPESLAMAIPWPADLLPEESPLQPRTTPEDNNAGLKSGEQPAEREKPRFIQVDLHIYESLEHMQYMLFKHAHGDIWNILGMSTRYGGLTVDDTGLFIRIPEIEQENRRLAKVLLTTEPSEILSFLGMQAANGEWDQEFPSIDAMFEYAATCRLFWARPDEHSDGNGHHSDHKSRKENNNSNDTKAAHRTDQDDVDTFSRTRANDRRRINQRPVFRQWIEDFVPSCRRLHRFSTLPPTREAIRAEALAAFPAAGREYSRRLGAWTRERQLRAVWDDIVSKYIPLDLEPSRRGVVAKAFRKVVVEGDLVTYGVPRGDRGKGEELRELAGKMRVKVNGDEDGDAWVFDKDSIEAFMREGWRDLMDRALALNDAKYRAAMEEKKRKEELEVGKNAATQEGDELGDEEMSSGDKREAEEDLVANFQGVKRSSSGTERSTIGEGVS